MTNEELRAIVTGELARVAPGNDLAAVDPDVDLRDALELDSMDFMSFVVGLHKALGVNIPESDYPRIRTVRGCTEYLARAAAGRQTA